MRETYRELRKLGVRAAIAPTPRALSKCCGVSLLVQEEDLETIKECIKTNEVDIWGIEAIEKDGSAINMDPDEMIKKLSVKYSFPEEMVSLFSKFDMHEHLSDKPKKTLPTTTLLKFHCRKK